LRPIARDEAVVFWDDNRIRPSEAWREQIDEGLERIDAAILLVSADFLASDFIHENELPPILNAWRTRGSRIYWVLLSPCDLDRYPSLLKLQSVNPNLQPLSELNRNEKERVWSRLAALIKQDLAQSRQDEDPARALIVPDGYIARDQVEALKKAASHVYRARNLSRKMSQQPVVTGEDTSDLRELRDHLADLADLLYNERAILPPALFDLIHPVKYTLFDFIKAVDLARRGQHPSSEETYASIVTHYQKLDIEYVNLLAAIQRALNVQ
jgi:hypothetical protein